MSKAIVTLGGVPLAANNPVIWKLQTGVTPYRTTFTVHKSDWPKLERQVGKPLTLKIDQGFASQTIRHVYILHQVASSSPNRVSFLVADIRWQWAYVLVARDYNIPRRSGNRTVLEEKAPKENTTTVDVYNFKEYSLDNGKKWTAQAAVEDVLGQVTDDGGPRFFIESWPIDESESEDEDLSYTLQNVVLRDQGDVALSRLLGFVPGATLYIDIGGQARIIDGADLQAAEEHRESLPDSTWDGDVSVMIDRKHIRPEVVNVHYAREVEAIFEYDDDLAVSTNPEPDPTEPYLENVIQTTDPETTVTVFDAIVGERVTYDVPQGTWVNFRDWLEAMEIQRAASSESGSLPWTWETIKRHWIKGDLEGVLGTGASRGIPDLETNNNVAMRVQALRQHFRQSFRINRRYMERIRDLKSTRVGPVDPVTGARSQGVLWGQYCIIPSTKGDRIAKRKDESRSGVWRNIDNLPDDETNVLDIPPAPARISFVDRDQGIFRVSWTPSPYGTVDTILPCNTVDKDGNKRVPVRNLLLQQERAMGPGLILNGGVNALFLADTMEMKVLFTVIPGAPNNKQQYHVETLEPKDIAEVFRTQLRIQDGVGPELDLFVTPNESSARFAIKTESQAKATLKEMLGIESDDITTAGVPKRTRDLFGYQWLNELNEVVPHAKSFAAEALVTFADSLMGRVSTAMPSKSLVLKGNMAGATLSVATAPSAKVQVVHEFSGQQKPISRNAMMSDDARKQALGIVPLKGEV